MRLSGQRPARKSSAAITTHSASAVRAGEGIRPAIAAALEVAERTGLPAAAIQLEDGRIVTGKTSPLMGASAGALLNALKALANIEKKVHLISPESILPIQRLKVEYLGSVNPRLHSDEILIALATSAKSDPLAAKALDQLAKLRDCQAHATVILSATDTGIYKKLGLQITCEAQYETKKLYHR